MSLALAARINEIERQLLELSRALNDSRALIKDLDARLTRAEQARKPGPKPKEAQ